MSLAARRHSSPKHRCAICGRSTAFVRRGGRRRRAHFRRDLCTRHWVAVLRRACATEMLAPVTAIPPLQEAA